MNSMSKKKKNKKKKNHEEVVYMPRQEEAPSEFGGTAVTIAKVILYSAITTAGTAAIAGLSIKAGSNKDMKLAKQNIHAERKLFHKTRYVNGLNEDVTANLTRDQKKFIKGGLNK